MLVESDPLHEGGSFEREREIRSTSVFLSGMFPEYVGDAAEARLRLDSLLDYVKAAKESCRIRPVRASCCATSSAGLAAEFEFCVYGLNRVKSGLEAMRDERYRTWRRNLLQA